VGNRPADTPPVRTQLTECPKFGFDLKLACWNNGYPEGRIRKVCAAWNYGEDRFVS
jgi:hypothetical protein